MEILFDVLYLILGITIVVWGADKFTDGASSMARRWNVSEMVIGLTVVAMGTSMPEFVVSFFSALNGKGDMSVGNVVGSNIFNTMMIVGVSAAMIPLTLTKKILTRDIFLVLFSSVILVALSYDGSISRSDALVMLGCFGMYMVYSYYVAKHNPEQQATGLVHGWGKTLLFLFLGLGCLVAGGQLMVNGATSLAVTCGMSERVIGLTILAVGTSLPELATSIVAARKGSTGLALGNAVGSNIFNIFFILGTSATLCPLTIGGISRLDWVILVGSAIVLLIFGGTKLQISRTEGFVMMALYIMYIGAVSMGVRI